MGYFDGAEVSEIETYILSELINEINSMLDFTGTMV